MVSVNSEGFRDVIDAEAYSVDELREAAFEGSGRLSRPLALSLLGRKRYPDKVQDLERLLTNEQEMPRMRAMAAQFLGEIGSADAISVLERGLETREGVALRAVAMALGNAGTREHVSSLESLARRPDPVGKAAQRALDVLASRLEGADPARGRSEEARLPLRETQQTTRIDVEEPPESEVREAARGAPSRRLSRESALSLRCQGRDLMLLFTEDSLQRGLGMFETGAEVGIVMERGRVETTSWEQRYRVVVEPRADREFDVVVTTHDARVVLRGRGQVRGNEARYEMGAIDAPGALPVEIRGRFDGRRLTMEEARSGVRRRPARTPSALHKP